MVRCSNWDGFKGCWALFFSISIKAVCCHELLQQAEQAAVSMLVYIRHRVLLRVDCAMVGDHQSPVFKVCLSSTMRCCVTLSRHPRLSRHVLCDNRAPYNLSYSLKQSAHPQKPSPGLADTLPQTMLNPCYNPAGPVFQTTDTATVQGPSWSLIPASIYLT